MLRPERIPRACAYSPFPINLSQYAIMSSGLCIVFSMPLPEKNLIPMPIPVPNSPSRRSSKRSHFLPFFFSLYCAYVPSVFFLSPAVCIISSSALKSSFLSDAIVSVSVTSSDVSAYLSARTAESSFSSGL